jgi:hypothetical protein
MTSSTTIHPDDELLVAYLNHELGAAEERQVEHRLATDPSFRSRLGGLQRSWDALDELPRSTLNAASAANTLSMVAMAAEQERSQCQTSPVSIWAPRMRRALFLAAGVLIGYVGIAATRRYEYNSKLRDLPVVYRMDAYRAVGDLAFLRHLDEEGVFAEDLLNNEGTAPGDTATPDDKTLLQPPFGLSMTTADIERTLRQLPIETIAEIQSRSRQFAALPPVEQAALRQLHDALVQEQDAAHLMAVLSRYHDWIAALPSSDRAELMELPTMERLEKTRKIMADQLRRHSDWMAATAGDVQHLQKWTADYVVRHARELLRVLPPRQQELLRNANPAQRPWLLVRAIANAPPHVKNNLPELSDEEKIRFLQGFSPELTQRVSQELQSRGTQTIFDIFQLLGVHRRGNPRRLEQFFEGLPLAEQKALLQLGPDQLPQELRERFWRRQEAGGGPGRRPMTQPDGRPRREPWAGDPRMRDPRRDQRRPPPPPRSDLPESG